MPLPESEGHLEPKAVDEFADRLDKAKALAIGPGLGRGPHAAAVVRRALDTGLPIVIDADGLWALSDVLKDEPNVLRDRAQPTILTPHGGEFAQLAGRAADDDRIADVREHAHRWGAVVHLKGRRAMTAAPDGTVWVNTTGNPGAATGGTGDVLTGIVGSLLAQGVDAPAAMWAGAHLHGLAADAAASRVGMRAMTSVDLADSIGAGLRAVARARTARGALRTVISAEANR